MVWEPFLQQSCYQDKTTKQKLNIRYPDSKPTLACAPTPPHPPLWYPAIRFLPSPPSPGSSPPTTPKVPFMMRDEQLSCGLGGFACC